jgi:hypothetical protein
MDDRRIHLRSYRLAFELERRIHRIDSFRIPLPYGLPLAALGWAAATLVLVVAVSPLPIIGDALEVAPMPVRLIFLPGLGAHLLCRVTGDGRPVHEALFARAAFVLRQKRRAGLAPLRRYVLDTAPLTIAPDERGERYRPGVVEGPVTLALRQPARITVERCEVRLLPGEDRAMLAAQEIRLREGQRLVVV